MVRMMLLRFPRKFSVDEGGVFRLVQNQFILPTRRQRWKDDETGRRIGCPNGSGVLGPGEHHPGDLHASKRLLRVTAATGTAWTHHDGRLDSRVREPLPDRKGLTAHRLRRHR